MKRLSTLALGFAAITWLTGCCCHSWCSRCVDYNDGCYAYNDGGYGSGDYGADCCQKPDRKRCRRNDCRDNRGGASSADACCCPTDCCDPCGTGAAVSPQPVMSSPGVTTFDSGAIPGATGCSSCGTSAATYGGMVIDPSQGWTITPLPSTTPGSSEPTPAPPAAGALAPVPAPATPASAPTPISPPVGSAR